MFNVNSSTVFHCNLAFSFLSVHTETLEKKLAVMIWFHGGAFALGASQGIDIMNSTLYDGYEIAHHGNVIVVTINYRLASLGFLSTGDENGRGNYGLWDQHMAIKWVKKNIANFGGNPGLITLFGESAGGASTSMHALSPVNKGLFRRVISESGDAQTMWAVNRRPLGAARRVAQAVGCPLEDKAAMMFCLRRVPAKDIVLAVRVTESLSNKEILFFLPFVPTIDGEFLPHEPVKLFENSKEIDYLLGCNSGDAHLFVSIWFPGVNIPFGISEAKFRAATEKGVGELNQNCLKFFTVLDRNKCCSRSLMGFSCSDLQIISWAKHSATITFMDLSMHEVIPFVETWRLVKFRYYKLLIDHHSEKELYNKE
uniref:Carboxylic ester hydrolase n=1 Tax=Callorhinchus milii TaxID=7868 RepID=A0A4W3K9R7_CALMI